MATFHLIPSDCIQYLPREALALLERACKRTPANVLPAAEILRRAQHGIGEIHLATAVGDIQGIIYLMAFPSDNGPILNIVMLGAKNLRKWKHDLEKFIVNTMINNHISTLCIATRKGWGKLFPRLKESGTIYTASIKH